MQVKQPRWLGTEREQDLGLVLEVIVAVIREVSVWLLVLEFVHQRRPFALEVVGDELLRALSYQLEKVRAEVQAWILLLRVFVLLPPPVAVPESVPVREASPGLVYQERSDLPLGLIQGIDANINYLVR
jgi:hypothetical protein